MKTDKSHFRWIQILVAILLVLGVFFRFVNLDHKVFWKDEAYTSLRISGYTKGDFLQNEFDGRVIGLEDLDKYQGPNPDKNLGDTIKSLATDAPQHSPLYFSLVKICSDLFGDSIVVPRTVSAIFSLFVFPALYFFCLELFESSAVAWVAVALMAVSPFNVLYAQEARQYSLWTVTTLVSGTALLRAMRLNTNTSWGVYLLTLVLGLYTYLFSLLVSVSHGIYVFVIERFRLTKNLIAYVATSILALVVFSPWIWVIINNSTRIQKNTAWNKEEMPLFILINFWLRNISYAFFDIQFGLDDPLGYAIPPVVILVGFAFYFLCREAPKQIWLYVVTLTAIPVLTLTLPDLISGGVRSITARYFVPSYVGIHLAVAYLLGTQLTSLSLKAWQQRMWQLITAGLITGGVISCVVISQADTWWSKSASYNDPKVARIVNAASQPLVISSDSTNVNVLSLAHMLDPKVKLQLMTEPNIPKIPDGYSDVFLYNVSPELKDAVEKAYNIEAKRVLKSRPTNLWKLEK